MRLVLSKVYPMQLHLTLDEFELLKQIVEDERRLSCCALPSSPQVPASSCLQDELEIGHYLLDKRLSRNLQLGFDELEDLAGSLKWRQRQIMREISCLGEPTTRSRLEHRLFILESFLERVTEACAML